VLKAVLVAIVAANLLFFGFTQGWFDGAFGLRARGDREPERLANQVRPNSIAVMPVPTPASAAPDAATGTCLEAGPIAAIDAASAEAALRAALPAGGWIDVRNEPPAGTPAFVTHTYRVAHADAATATRLGALKLDAAGRGFSACARPAPGR
jgi:hypothetical protein